MYYYRVLFRIISYANYLKLKNFLQFRHQIKRGLQKTPCCKHRIKTARQRDDDVIDKAHHQMYASTGELY